MRGGPLSTSERIFIPSSGGVGNFGPVGSPPLFNKRWAVTCASFKSVGVITDVYVIPAKYRLKTLRLGKPGTLGCPPGVATPPTSANGSNCGLRNVARLIDSRSLVVMLKSVFPENSLRLSVAVPLGVNIPFGLVGILSFVMIACDTGVEAAWVNDSLSRQLRVRLKIRMCLQELHYAGIRLAIVGLGEISGQLSRA